MRLTTERKLCAGVLTLAIIALGVDRLILGGGGGPAAAGAAELLAADVAAASDAPVAPVPGAAPLARGVPVASQLEMLGAAADGWPDGFDAPARWREALERVRARSGPEPVTAAPEQDPAVTRFLANQLTAVLSEQGQPVRALVKLASAPDRRLASRLLKVGDELDGFTLIVLEANRATFKDPSGSIAVELEVPIVGAK